MDKSSTTQAGRKRPPGRCAYCDSEVFRVHPNGVGMCAKHYWRSRRANWSLDPSPRNVALTEEQLRQAADMRARGVAAKLIARALGVSYPTLLGIFRRGGYRPTTEPLPKRPRLRRKPGPDEGLGQPRE